MSIRPLKNISPCFQCIIFALNNLFLADLKLDFGRPIWIDIDLALLERLNDFASDLNMEQTKLDSGRANNSDTEMMNIVRSVAISSDYVAITATAGEDRKIDPMIKVSCSSMNLGVSLKGDERQGKTACFPKEFLKIHQYFMTNLYFRRFLPACRRKSSSVRPNYIY